MGFHDHPGPYRSRGRVWSPCRAEQFTVRDVWPTLTTMQWIPKVPWGWKMLGNGVGNGVGFLKSHDVGKKTCWKMLEMDIPSLPQVWLKQSSSACCSKVRWIESATRRSNQLCKWLIGCATNWVRFFGDGCAVSYLQGPYGMSASVIISMLEVIDYSSGWTFY
jgi:hypothetical protein